MSSTSDQIQALHQSYCDSLNLPLPMNNSYERWWYEALKLGLTPEHIELCIAARLKFNRAHPGHGKGLELKHLIRSEDDVAVVLNEVAVIIASRRKKVFSPAKAQALRDVGLPDAPPQPDAKHVAEYIAEMNRVVEEAVAARKAK